MLGNQIQFLESSDWTNLQNDGVSLVLYKPCHHWIWLEMPIYPSPCLCSQTSTVVNQREGGLCSLLAPDSSGWNCNTVALKANLTPPVL